MHKAVIGFATLVTLAAAAPPAERFEAVLRGGTILDGSGLVPYPADIAIAEGRIARIGDLARVSADLELDARGLYVAPGFINIHSHPAPAALARAENMLTQGVTTGILNADGSGAVDLEAQRAHLSASGLAVNIGGYIGFNSIWSQVVGASDRRPPAEEVERMRGLITAGMEAGAWGVSAGLDYKPASFARTEEVAAVVSAAAPWRTNFNNHHRVLPESGYSSSIGIAETLRIADEAGLVPVVTHMTATGGEGAAAARALSLFDAPGRAGNYAAAGVCPYPAVGVESDLAAILKHPAASIACDCGATTATATDSRHYGSYPRVLGRYVREQQLLSWQEAIRKMTALPAATIGLADRGYIAHGMAADITVFDPRTIIDHATRENPAALSEGVRHVFVNGVLALRDGAVTGARGGRTLVRRTGMPSRRMTAPTQARRIGVTGRFGRAVLDVDVSQPAGRRDARGTLKIRVPDADASLSVTRFGVLQIGEKWASLTGEAKLQPAGVERHVTITVDANDPGLEPGGAVVLVDVEGLRAYRFSLPATAIHWNAR